MQLLKQNSANGMKLLQNPMYTIITVLTGTNQKTMFFGDSIKLKLQLTKHGMYSADMTVQFSGWQTLTSSLQMLTHQAMQTLSQMHRTILQKHRQNLLLTQLRNMQTQLIRLNTMQQKQQLTRTKLFSVIL
ncbi:MAG: hypothetical protein IJ279_06510 [Clostridia bacterium]|nr:hypothetical protein [Clostridia bacterium]